MEYRGPQTSTPYKSSAPKSGSWEIEQSSILSENDLTSPITQDVLDDSGTWHGMKGHEILLEGALDCAPEDRKGGDSAYSIWIRDNCDLLLDDFEEKLANLVNPISPEGFFTSFPNKEGLHGNANNLLMFYHDPDIVHRKASVNKGDMQSSPEKVNKHRANYDESYHLGSPISYISIEESDNIGKRKMDWKNANEITPLQYKSLDPKVREKYRIFESEAFRYRDSNIYKPEKSKFEHRAQGNRSVDELNEIFAQKKRFIGDFYLNISRKIQEGKVKEFSDLDKFNPINEGVGTYDDCMPCSEDYDNYLQYCTEKYPAAHIDVLKWTASEFIDRVKNILSRREELLGQKISGQFFTSMAIDLEMQLAVKQIDILEGSVACSGAKRQMQSLLPRGKKSNIPAVGFATRDFFHHIDGIEGMPFYKFKPVFTEFLSKAQDAITDEANDSCNIKKFSDISEILKSGVIETTIDDDFYEQCYLDEVSVRTKKVLTLDRFVSDAKKLVENVKKSLVNRLEYRYSDEKLKLNEAVVEQIYGEEISLCYRLLKSSSSYEDFKEKSDRITRGDIDSARIISPDLMFQGKNNHDASYTESRIREENSQRAKFYEKEARIYEGLYCKNGKEMCLQKKRMREILANSITNIAPIIHHQAKNIKHNKYPAEVRRPKLKVLYPDKRKAPPYILSRPQYGCLEELAEAIRQSRLRSSVQYQGKKYTKGVRVKYRIDDQEELNRLYDLIELFYHRGQLPEAYDLNEKYKDVFGKINKVTRLGPKSDPKTIKRFLKKRVNKGQYSFNDEILLIEQSLFFSSFFKEHYCDKKTIEQLKEVLEGTEDDKFVELKHFMKKSTEEIIGLLRQEEQFENLDQNLQTIINYCAERFTRNARANGYLVVRCDYTMPPQIIEYELKRDKEKSHRTKLTKRQEIKRENQSEIEAIRSLCQSEDSEFIFDQGDTYLAKKLEGLKIYSENTRLVTHSIHNYDTTSGNILSQLKNSNSFSTIIYPHTEESGKVTIKYITKGSSKWKKGTISDLSDPQKISQKIQELQDPILTITDPRCNYRYDSQSSEANFVTFKNQFIYCENLTESRLWQMSDPNITNTKIISSHRDKDSFIRKTEEISHRERQSEFDAYILSKMGRRLTIEELLESFKYFEHLIRANQAFGRFESYKKTRKKNDFLDNQHEELRKLRAELQEGHDKEFSNPNLFTEEEIQQLDQKYSALMSRFENQEGQLIQLERKRTSAKKVINLTTVERVSNANEGNIRTD